MGFPRSTQPKDRKLDRGLNEEGCLCEKIKNFRILLQNIYNVGYCKSRVVELFDDPVEESTNKLYKLL